MANTQCSDKIIEIIDLNLGGWEEMGGPGSGHWRHAGRKGKKGGSAPSKGKTLQFKPVPIGQRGVRTFGTGRGAFLSKPPPMRERTGTQSPTDSTVKIDKRSLTAQEQQHIANTVRALPQEHLDLVRVINQRDLGRNLGGECSVDREITLNKSQGTTMYDSGTIIHEIGHAVMYHKGGRTSAHAKQFETYYKEKVKSSGLPKRQVAAMARGTFAKPVKGFPSGYSMFNSEELFAESYLMYTKSPGILSQRAPDLYNYMRDSVFGGVEY